MPGRNTCRIIKQGVSNALLGNTPSRLTQQRPLIVKVKRSQPIRHRPILFFPINLFDRRQLAYDGRYTFSTYARAFPLPAYPHFLRPLADGCTDDEPFPVGPSGGDP